MSPGLALTVAVSRVVKVRGCGPLDTHSGDPISDLKACAELIRDQRPPKDLIVVRVGLRAVWDELVRCEPLNPTRFVAMPWLAFRQPYQERERSSGCLNISACQRNAELGWGWPVTRRCGVLLGAIGLPLRALSFTIGDVKRELRGKNLACWCKESPCHADVSLEVANG